VPRKHPFLSYPYNGTDTATRTAISAIPAVATGQTLYGRMPVLGSHHANWGWPSVPGRSRRPVRSSPSTTTSRRTSTNGQRRHDRPGTGAYGSCELPWWCIHSRDGVCAAARLVTWLWPDARSQGDPPSVGGSPRQYRRPDDLPEDSGLGERCRVPGSRRTRADYADYQQRFQPGFTPIQLPGRDHHQPPGHRVGRRTSSMTTSAQMARSSAPTGHGVRRRVVGSDRTTSKS